MAQPDDSDAMDISETDDDENDNDNLNGYETDDTVDAENPDEDGKRAIREYLAREAAALDEPRRQASSTPPPTNMRFATPSTEIVPDLGTGRANSRRGLSDIQPLDLFGAKNDKYKGKGGGASKSKRRSKRRRAKKSLRKRRTSRKRKTNKRRTTRTRSKK
jgi:hypothetical protein